VTDTSTFEDAGARTWARQVAAELPYPELAGDVENALHTMLATTDRHAWDDVLAHGVTLTTHGRLVWLRPLLAGLRPADEAQTTVREYNVRFATTAGSGARNRERTFGADSALLLGFSTASAVASSMILGMPQLRAEAAADSSETQRRNVVSGRTLFIGGNKPFSAGLRVEVFVDGAGHQPTPVFERGLRVEFPREYTGADAPRPPMEPAAAALPPGESRLGPDRVVLNAVDLGPLVAALHGGLLRAGLNASTAERFMTHARELLNERTARTRSRWWLTNGDISGAIQVSGSAGRSFRGRLRVRAEIDGLEFAGITENVQIRDDLGGGSARGLGRAGSGSAGISFGYNAFGFSMPVTDGGGSSAAKGLLPLFGFGFDRGTGSGLSVTSQTLGHTVLNFRENQARYRARLRITVAVESPTHPRIGAVSEVVEAEIGVPWRDGQGAADFENRVLGRVHTTGLLPEGPSEPPVPVPALPHVRELLRESGTEPVRAMEPPQGPAPADRQEPEPAEPSVLAARRGLGFAMALDMAGSEVVQDQLSWALKQMVPPSVRRSADWAAVEAQLGLHFGRPALEGRLPLEETVHMLTVGGERYRASVKAILREHRPGRSYPMTVNARAARTETVTGQRGTEWSAVAGAGGGVILPLGGSTRLRIGGVTVRGGYERSQEEQFTAANTVYRRTETEGDIDEHVYDTVYELSLRPENPGRRRRAERWWIERPYLTTTIVVPRQNVPAQPPEPVPVAEVGRTTFLRAWPDATRAEVDFTQGGTGGVYPAFLVMPELTRLAATGYARLAGLSPRWLDDSTGWPQQLGELTDSAALAARIGALTGPDGYGTALPKRDGWRYAVRLRLRAFSARDLGETAGDTEIEQYSQASDRYGRAEKSGWHAGLNAGAGPQIGVGALASGGTHHEGAAVLARQEAEEGSATEGHRQGGAGLRAVALAQTGAQWAWGSGRERIGGSVEISRATYREKTHVVQAAPVFEVSVVRSKGGRREEFVRYLRVEHGLEMLVPERRVPDLLPPRPVQNDAPQAGPSHVGEAEAGPSRVGEAEAGPSHVGEAEAGPSRVGEAEAGPSHVGEAEAGPSRVGEAEAGPSPVGQAQAGPSEAGPSSSGPSRADTLTRTHLLGRPLPGAAHVERLRADDVLKTIVERLAGRGVAGKSGSAYEHLLRALGATFSSDALQTQYTALTGTGVARWFPVSGPFGSTRYVWVMVTADLSAPHSHRSRAKVKLTLRSEGVTEEKTGGESSFRTGVGIGVRTRIGNHEGHGGIEIEASYGASRERSHETARQIVDIARANTREGSEEFEHELTFRIRMGATTEPPAALSVPVQAVRDAALRVAALVRGGDPARRGDPVRMWTWQDDGLGDRKPVTGDVRLLVPTHLTAPAEQPVPPTVAPMRP
jgi:hypothetical protein